MNIADAINPYVFQNVVEPTKNQDSLITSAGHITIYSVLDEITISSSPSLAQYATVVADEYDLVVYGLDVVIAGNLTSTNRGPSASRNISIFCRTLEIVGDADPNVAVLIDVSGASNAALDTHLQPDRALASLAGNTQGANGDDIAYALNNRSPNNPYTNWFDKDPGQGWATKGATGGAINIACETLILHNKLTLSANGGKGNAGVGGQNVQNWFAGNVGGDAGSGGSPGDSGTITLTFNKSVDAKKNPISADDWITLECTAGAEGDPGQPGSAYEPSENNYHYGSYATSPAPGISRDGEQIMPDDLNYNAGTSRVPDMRTIPDLSMIASNCDLHYWSLLYHRAKLEYLKRQPMKFEMPSAIDPSWVELGDLIKWCWRFCFAYGDTSTDLRTNCIGNVADDSNATAKDTIARALKQMQSWYMNGKTMWGHDVTTTTPMPFDTLCGYIDDYYPRQAAVRDFYITLRTQLAAALKDSANLTTMSNSAEYAVEMHEANCDELKKLLFGDSNANQTDSLSLIGELNAATTAVNSAIADLSPELSQLDGPIKNAVGINAGDVLSAISSMAFVIADPPAFAVMGSAEGLGLYEKAKNQVIDDNGNPQSKAAVISQLHNLKGGVDDLKTLMTGMASNNQVGKLDEAVLTSLDNIDNYVSQFTQALGDIGQDVLSKVSDLRGLVNHKNDLWMNYNDRLYQLAKEWEDYQSALAKKQAIDSTENPVSADLVNAVQIYTGVYLDNLERSADLWAQLVRKYAYITLDATLQDNDMVVGDKSLTAFWSAERTTAQAMADQANGNFDLESNAFVGKQSGSLRYQLGQYDADTKSIVLHAPSDGATDQKSTFYISIHGNGSKTDQDIIRDLLAHKSRWIQIIPEGIPQYSPTNKAPDVSADCVAKPYPLTSDKDWDVRITHVNPWIEGIKTDTSTVGFHIKLGSKAYIMNTSSAACYFDYGLSGVNSEFAHYTDAVLSDNTNSRMAGGGDGAVADANMDKRGIYAQMLLSIPDSSLNAGLAVAAANAADISKVNLRVYFRVLFRAPAST